ncbi:DNA topoisomerase III [Anaerotalea alkaliphila]|uniref:DNA topoisomerase 3 n=1 Tax=Anaerotalea alkaliphila TaxID=2662126 RepID=A0A7X5HXG4_9FIRM|nr:DNA topoisomerase III [Anaerotalea alkaliphila]NDL68425.1 DNA topoisomerase III [Anaerotalea alkaliphila]
MKQMRCVLAEKPSVGRDLARVLGCHKKGNGYYEGEGTIVTWALGHLVTLASPEKYDPKYEKWSLETLPMIPKEVKLEVIGQTAKQYKVVRDLLHRNDVGEVVIATDAGREGELVARLVLEKAGVQKPLKRLWISSVTDQAIRQGFERLKEGREYENLYRSALARSEADWLVGLNASRALTCKFNAQLSCGRVQTPTLAMVERRENEIRHFVPRSYYGVQLEAEGTRFRWQDPSSKAWNMEGHRQAERVLEACGNRNLEVVRVERQKKRQYAPALYDLTELQRDANRMYDFSAKETLQILQGLYEGHKVVTYPRTDSRHLTSDMVGTLKERLNACAVGPFKKTASLLARQGVAEDKRFVDDARVSDHHAIIPTEQPVDLARFSHKERMLYDLVVRRFLAVLSPPHVYEQMTITARVGGETFVASGSRTLEPGFKEVSAETDLAGEDGEEEGASGPVAMDPVEGKVYPVKRCWIMEGKTKPPAWFTEASLLTAMENPRRYMETRDQELLKAITETGGLGTVATRADIIDKLFGSFLLEKKGKEIHITSKGRQLLGLVPEGLKSPEMTAIWERKLDAIAKGKLDMGDFLREMEDYTRSVVREIKNKEETFRHDNVTGTRCPACGKFMLEVSGKNGRMLVCQDRECGHRENLARTTNARCPQCRKKLDLVGEGDGKIFVCKCGFREKLSAFNKRKGDAPGKVSKKEVSSYLQQSKKEAEAPFNNPFADAFKNLK